ncbi:hypothetical protein CC86DRAFT_383305 [Ophiobolus disseminans]|uniref:Uncharacterized protein n=1 Tax=Ophiobolus disseminans TaxID=1469910 RepID=A0A6A6ZYM4_9PLEO|nr:hypothetical protein CC86DRAFT_383305 [Ophiobolus disseminans]
MTDDDNETRGVALDDATKLDDGDATGLDIEDVTALNEEDSTALDEDKDNATSLSVEDATVLDEREDTISLDVEDASALDVDDAMSLDVDDATGLNEDEEDTTSLNPGLLDGEAETGVGDKTLIEVEYMSRLDDEDETENSTEDETMSDEIIETTVGVSRAAGVELGTALRLDRLDADETTGAELERGRQTGAKQLAAEMTAFLTEKSKKLVENEFT